MCAALLCAALAAAGAAAGGAASASRTEAAAEPQKQEIWDGSRAIRLSASARERRGKIVTALGEAKREIPGENSRAGIEERGETAAGGRECLGIFTATAYCPCAKCCGAWSNPAEPRTASGTVAAAGRTVGADFATLPAGTVIEIEGVGARVVEDKPARFIIERYAGRILDIYFDTHEEALAFGKQTVRVYRAPSNSVGSQ